MSDNNVFLEVRGHEKVTATNTNTEVTSAAVTTLAAVERGIRRIIQNNSTGVVYVLKSSSTGGATSGIVIAANERYIDTLYMGAEYLLASTTGCDVRVETIALST